jgi:hypothetical protein
MHPLSIFHPSYVVHSQDLTPAIIYEEIIACTPLVITPSPYLGATKPEMISKAHVLLDLRRFLIAALILVSASALGATTSIKQFSEEERAYWAFQPISRPDLPTVQNKAWVRNPIDAFILKRIEDQELTPTPEADRITLIRRASMDLLGIPPTPEQIDAFVKDTASDAYERLIDRMLDSPRYGERYARHWLDLVRYADSDGFKSDVLRPDAWRYRDYVIESLNQDKPYSRFVKEQIAGDELYPNNDDAKKATGYLRLWPYEDNQPDMSRHWEATLDDIADVSGDVFLGMSMKCARCHDHKFDAITQKDYYSFRSFFAAISPWEDVRLGDEKEAQDYGEQFREWEIMTTGIRAEMEEIKAKPFQVHWDAALAKLPEYMQDILAKTERAPYEEQLARFGIQLMTNRATVAFDKQMKTGKNTRWIELQKQLSAFDDFKPKELERVSAVRDIGGKPPVTYIDAKESRGQVLPAYLSILDPGDAKIDSIPNNPNTTGRRTALADWLTDGENPLSVRVIVNRLWQWHFGTGIVSSSNDLGKLGDRPTHPELLDWLARKFVADGWSMKSMHRLMMTSATYRQGSLRVDAKAELADEKNRLFWKMPVRRMDAEQLRDSMLFVSGEIMTEMGGPAVDEEKSSRRSIYVINKRNKLLTTMNNFDTPDLHNSCHMRDVTTTPIQALALLNGPWTLARAEGFAKEVINCEASNIEERIDTAYRNALGRRPLEDELAVAQSFIESAGTESEDRENAWVDFCHVLLNTNEFLYTN